MLENLKKGPCRVRVVFHKHAELLDVDVNYFCTSTLFFKFYVAFNIIITFLLIIFISLLILFLGDVHVYKFKKLSSEYYSLVDFINVKTSLGVSILVLYVVVPP